MAKPGPALRHDTNHTRSSGGSRACLALRHHPSHAITLRLRPTVSVLCFVGPQQAAAPEYSICTGTPSYAFPNVGVVPFAALLHTSAPPFSSFGGVGQRCVMLSMNVLEWRTSDFFCAIANESCCRDQAESPSHNSLCDVCVADTCQTPRLSALNHSLTPRFHSPRLCVCVCVCVCVCARACSLGAEDDEAGAATTPVKSSDGKKPKTSSGKKKASGEGGAKSAAAADPVADL